MSAAQGTIGMNAATGKDIAGPARLRQSITDVLTTPIGSRVGRRDYGSLLPELISQPMNGAGVQRLYAATALAIARHERSAKVRKIALGQDAVGAFEVKLLIEDTSDSAQTKRLNALSIPLSAASA